MEAFRDTIEGLHLVDIPTINGAFTWNKRRGGPQLVASRMDRFLVSEQVISRDIFLEASILPGLGLDHWPIRMELDLKAGPKNRPFRFEAF